MADQQKSHALRMEDRLYSYMESALTVVFAVLLSIPVITLNGALRVLCRVLKIPPPDIGQVESASINEDISADASEVFQKNVFEPADQVVAVNFEHFIAYLWIYVGTGKITRQLKCIRKDLIDMLGCDRFPMSTLTYGGGMEAVTKAMLDTERDGIAIIRNLMQGKEYRPESSPEPGSGTGRADHSEAEPSQQQPGRDAAGPKKPRPSDTAPDLETPFEEELVGKVLDFGITERSFGKSGSKSPTFFIKLLLADENSAVIRYGTVLEDEIVKQGVDRGDHIRLRLLGRDRVGDSGSKKGGRYRNVWEILKFSR